MLEVRKPKETKLLQIAVTLHDPQMAHRVSEFIAQRTVELSTRVAGDADLVTVEKARTRSEAARDNLSRLERESSALASNGQRTALEAELLALSKVRGELVSDLNGTSARIAELAAVQTAATAKDDIGLELRAQKARRGSLEESRDRLDREIDTKSAALSSAEAAKVALEGRLQTARHDFDTASKRLLDAEGAAGTRGEQLRIVDPGIVPQRPSWPNLPLNSATALVLGSVAALVYLGMRFGLESHRARLVRTSIKVAQRDSA